MDKRRQEPSRITLCVEDDDIVTITQKDTLFNQAFTVFGELRRAGQLCDITVLADGSRFRAHKVVLASTIPYFRAMFTTDLIESTLTEIRVQELEGDTLEQLISFAYCGELRISVGNVQSIMIGANFLQLEDVVEECASFLLKRLHPQNALAVRSFCSALGCRSVIPFTNSFIQKHFMAISQGAEFLALEVEDVMRILSNDNLYVESEEDIFNAALRWIEHGDGDRRIHAAKLLSTVRLHLLKPSFLTDQVAAHNLIKLDLKCRDLVDEAKDYHLIPERRNLLNCYKVKPRCCIDAPGLIYAVGGLTSGSESSAVEVFDPLTRKWSPVKAMPSLRSRVGVAVSERKVYAIGGFNGIDRLKVVECYDYTTNEWKTCSPLEKKRSALGAAFLHHKLYVCGGYDGITSLATVEVFDPLKNSWCFGPPMSKQRSAAGVTVLDGYLYVIGGHDGMCIFNSVERYCIEKNAWEVVPSMISKRCRLGAATLNGKIYVCGGYDGTQFLSSVEMFDPETMRWTPVTPMRIKRSRVSLVANANRIYAIAGYDGISNLSSMEVYSEETDEWNLGPSLNIHEGGVGVGVIPIPPAML